MILCSTGALIGRPNGRDYRLIETCAKELQCDGFEFMMYSDWYDKVDEIAEFIRSRSVCVPVFHCEKKVGDLLSRNQEGDCEQAVELFRLNCEAAVKIGCQKLVLHLWGAIDSDKDIEHNISYYPILRQMAEEQNLLLTIENVVCNRQDPMTHLLTMARRFPDIAFTYDTKMADFHKQIEQLYENTEQVKHQFVNDDVTRTDGAGEMLPDIFAHVRHMHINDYNGGYMDWSKLSTLHVGEGQIDFDRFFAFVKEQGYEGDYTIEATSFDQNGTIDFTKMNETIGKIRAYIK